MTEPLSEELQRRSEAWSRLTPGTALILVKEAPDGSEVARYAGDVVALHKPEKWAVIRAAWTYQSLHLDGLWFHPADILLEWFSAVHPFNAFAIFSPAGQFRGWYANVTLPAYLEAPSENGEAIVLVWHDLYLDLIGLPNGDFVIRDEDELSTARVEERDPVLYERIRAAIGELERRFRDRRLPFVDPHDLFAGLVGGDQP